MNFWACINDNALESDMIFWGFHKYRKHLKSMCDEPNKDITA